VSLGSLYEKGWGVRQDVDAARRLYTQAAGSHAEFVAQMARQYLARVSTRTGPAIEAPQVSSNTVKTAVVGGLVILTLGWLLHSGSGSSSDSGSTFNWTPETSYEDQAMRRMQVGCLWDEASFINYGTCMGS
jgi:TPR repeat protein